MEVHRQTCQLCGSHELRNILAREPGEPDKVFVQCHQCHELVARYVISPGGYFHAHKGFESFLRGLHRSGESMSGREMDQGLKGIEDKVEQHFEQVKAQLIKEDKLD